jgi:hypothetical protein
MLTRWVWGIAIGLASSTLLQCSGKTVVETPNQAPVRAGASCTTESQTQQADDHCNVCTCHHGTWQCTTIDCTVPCAPGQSQTSPDGCNTCGCTETGWACTLNPCAGPCPPPVGPGCGGAMNSLFARNPSSGDCCEYPNSGCGAPRGWRTFASASECVANVPDCAPGATMIEECGTCTCSQNGAWSCGVTACGGFAGQ